MKILRLRYPKIGWCKRHSCDPSGLISAILLCVIVILSKFCEPLMGQEAETGEWCYDSASCGPATWGGLCKTGKKQSPVNVPISKVISKPLQNTRIIVNRNYASPKLFFVRNSGRHLEVAINADLKSKCYLKGDGLRAGTYYFAQLHFHWGPNNVVGSEHFISGRSFPLEMHLVHVSVKKPKRFAVLAVLFYLSDDDNQQLKPILKLIPNVTEPGTVVKTSPNVKLTLTNLFPKKMRMFRYIGSLTTPPCTENVIWTVFRDPLPISKKQLAKFRTLDGLDGRKILTNHRPAQEAFTSERKKIFYLRQLRTRNDEVYEQYPSSYSEHDVELIKYSGNGSSPSRMKDYPIVEDKEDFHHIDYNPYEYNNYDDDEDQGHFQFPHNYYNDSTVYNTDTDTYN